MKASLVVLCAFIAVALGHFVLDKHAPLDRYGLPRIPCLTQHIFEERGYASEKSARACAGQGQCDNQAYRDAVGNNNTIITINLAVHVMNSATGQAPDGVGAPQIQSLLTRLSQNYGAYGFAFSSQVLYHNDAKYYCIPGYSGTNSNWVDAIEGMKKQYAVSPATTLNIFVSCMDVSLQGTLFGIATFPWDPIAVTATGGLWLNGIAVDSQAQADGDVTLEHELGHCLGLWHTFHGSDEVLGCNLACEELPHPQIDPSANDVGDFCADTPATPRNYDCANPGGQACNGENWGATDYTNFMGYGMDPQPCGDHFTPQQRARLHCWTCSALKGMTTAGCENF